MTGSALMSEIISILISGITSFATGLGSGITALINALFFDLSGQTPTLSTFGVCVIVFAGVSLAIGLSRWVLNFISSLGARNR